MHLTIHELEQYHTGNTLGFELSRVEQHLVWCLECVDRSAAIDRFVKIAQSGAIRAHLDYSVPRAAGSY
jgi:hypothetical protein